MNHTVELLRFLFAVVIVIHHIAIVTGTETALLVWSSFIF